MDYQYANVIKENHVTTVEVNNAPANALSSAVIGELRNLFQTLANDDETRVIILTGAGRFFVAGADIKEFVSVMEEEEKALAMSEAGQELCNEIEAMRKPVIASINGPALGGGLELAMSCHFRIASDAATLGLPELKLGLIPSFGGTQRLSKITGPATALNLILSSKQLNSEEVADLGIVQFVVQQEELLPTTVALAQSLVEGKSMTSVTRAVECIMQGHTEKMADGLERERKKFAELFLTKDAKEGVQAFIEKRKPNFTHS
ncbi:enoyl-CoA hydratase-related protein [Halobacillus shinanisalinarum]|uniref:Enoyl-CoA hydratase-related protein n=1 Tax=Halobacillus shinanisalinarum TaxID=2932258 RepID=A0ABY4GY68_9BACI|nr:enoyl-CoA hydratase-related protein [Halobacillus shinanisalinarum]UOQ93147.1 enoyl-CoA hydratase-related protein [Halobacillus shinanisalinarum]